MRIRASGRIQFCSALRMVGLLLAASLCLHAQAQAPLAWTPFGNTSVVASVAGVASGAVDRVWWGEAGAVWIALPGGEVLRSTDLQDWELVPEAQPPARAAASYQQLPAIGMRALVRSHPLQPTLVFALADQLYRSDDNGENFSGLTRYRQLSLLGDVLSDLALNPADPADLLVASDLGLWRSRDGGLSWFHASGSLPNLPLRRIAAFPQGTRGLLVETPAGQVLEWMPGAVRGYRGVSEALGARPAALATFGSRLSAWQSEGSQLYVGLRDGRLLATRDAGLTWREYSLPGWGAARQIAVNPLDERMALALATVENGEPLLLRTLNGGVFWEDFTPTGFRAAEAIAADWERGTLFAVTDAGLLTVDTDFRSMARPAAGRLLSMEGLPLPLADLRLDPSGTALFAVTKRQGVFTLPLPALGKAPRIRTAADLSQRPVAPGSLLSVHGAAVEQLRANGRDAVLLGNTDGATQVQLPYGLVGDQVQLQLRSASNAQALQFALRRTSPAVFVHPDGNPFVLHADNGVLMDEDNPLAPGERIHVMMGGLGGITPDWPAGLAAPLDNPPAVNALVEAAVNGVRVPVSRATLAPGYAGIYLVELVLPAVLDEGVVELQVYADGFASNAVPLHVTYEADSFANSIVLP